MAVYAASRPAKRPARPCQPPLLASPEITRRPFALSQRARLTPNRFLMVCRPGVPWRALISTSSVIGVDDLSLAVTVGGTGAAGRLRPLSAPCPGLRGFGHLLGCPGDSHQASQAWPLKDLADVVERDDQFLEPVQRSVVLPVQQNAAVLLGSDGPAGQLDLPALGAEQGLDGGVESERQRGELGGGEGALAALGLVDGLPAPGFAQVTAEGFAEVGQRQPPLRPQACDLPAYGFFDPHPTSRVSFLALTMYHCD